MQGSENVDSRRQFPASRLNRDAQPQTLDRVRVRVSAVEVSSKLGISVLDPALLSVRTAEMFVAALKRN